MTLLIKQMLCVRVRESVCAHMCEYMCVCVCMCVAMAGVYSISV